MFFFCHMKLSMIKTRIKNSGLGFPFLHNILAMIDVHFASIPQIMFCPEKQNEGQELSCVDVAVGFLCVRRR